MVFHSLALASGLWHDAGMTIGKGKRPRDPNQLAKWTVDVSTGQIPAPEEAATPAIVTPPANLSEYMAAIGRKGGQIGGKRRISTMTKEQRPKVAAKGPRSLENPLIVAPTSMHRHMAVQIGQRTIFEHRLSFTK